ncbi:GMC family oxidoreductase N-terminal domain-containing protein, partial [Pseudomonas viridiflava]|uniref:GMC family oxidoreductase N-terminal domain-containing protein n=1 Tax=Pseudomonas viridiflava TaxID=33069 RepID=UPI0019D20FDA
PPNANNDLIRKGCGKLGYSWHVIPRYVRGGFNLGDYGMGCPVNAKQSMLVTAIPAALELGATLLTRARAERLVIKGDQVTQLDCVALDAAGLAPTGRRITLRAKHFVLSGGAINTPA